MFNWLWMFRKRWDQSSLGPFLREETSGRVRMGVRGWDLLVRVKCLGTKDGVDWPEKGEGLAGDWRQKLWLFLWLTLKTAHTFPKRLRGLSWLHICGSACHRVQGLSLCCPSPAQQAGLCVQNAWNWVSGATSSPYLETPIEVAPSRERLCMSMRTHFSVRMKDTRSRTCVGSTSATNQHLLRATWLLMNWKGSCCRSYFEDTKSKVRNLLALVISMIHGLWLILFSVYPLVSPTPSIRHAPSKYLLSKGMKFH